jgi:hypothetical protein
MYKEILNKKNTNNIDMITDLNNFFIESKKWNLLNYRDIVIEPTRGKEMFIERDGKHYSFYSTKYNYVNIEGNSPNYLEQPLENSNVEGTGHFGVYLNTGYDQFNNAYSQPSNNLTNTNSNHMCSILPIPFSSVFNYRLLTTVDEYNFIIELEYNNFKFYLFFGDLLKGQLDKNGNPSGQFCFSSYNIDSTSGNRRVGIQKDLYSDTINIDTYKTANNPLHSVSNFNFYYYNNAGELIDQDLIASKVSGNCGFLNTGFLNTNTDFVLRSINDDFFGLEHLINFELYFEESDDNVLLLSDFSFGFLNDRNINDKEIIIINDKKYEILHFYYNKKDVLDINSKITKGIAMFIERLDL